RKQGNRVIESSDFGITSGEWDSRPRQFVDHSIQAYKDSQSRPLADVLPELANRNRENALVELLFGRKAQSDAKNLTHRQPELPFILGDACYRPSEINRFNGKLLHYISGIRMLLETAF